MTRPHFRSAAFTLSVVAALGLTACGGGGFEEEPSSQGSPASASGPVELSMLIASSGDAETNAVKEATQAWAEATGNTVTVTVASDMNQELAQGFASGSPADIFYMDAGRFADYAKNGSLFAYQTADNNDFYESLRQTFTYDGTQYCAPKDFSALALQINTAAWESAGLTDADIPTTWEQLSDVAATLTTDGQVGLGLSTGIDRIGAFVVQNGGWWLTKDSTAPAATDQSVLDALTYVQEQVKAGSFQFAPALDTGWGGEAFGTGKSAMTIEGNWIKGAMSNDYPDVEYLTVELPEGDAGQGTLMFTQCWGVAADSSAQAQAVDLVEALTTPQQQMAFADAFGVMPSRMSAAEEYTTTYPDDTAFIAGGEYGHGPINAPGMEQVVADLNSQLENLANADLPSVLDSFNTNATAALGG